MKIIRYDNPEPANITTSLSVEVDYNSNTINVLNGSFFAEDDFLLIENVGHEKCEIVKILSINVNELTITPTTLPHSINTTITKLYYDKYKIKKSPTLTGLFVDVHVGDIDYSNPHNIIYYIDNDVNASSNLYYKIYYYNSETEVEVEQTVLNKERNYGYIDIATFRAETGFSENEVSDAEVERAILSGLEWIQDNAYVYHEFDGPRDSVYSINSNMEFADWNGDNVVDKYDILVYEFDSNTLMRRYIGNKIIKVLPNSKKLFFSEKVPITPTNQLVIKIPMTFKKLDDIKNTLANISKLIGTNTILKDIDTTKIKQGITSWTAGGTSVNRDLGNLKDSIEKNYEMAKRLLTQVCEIYVRNTKLRTSKSSLNNRLRYSNRYSNISWRF